MAPKKTQKMSLNDFLADETTGKTSWADDVDDLPLAPAPRDDRYGRRGGDFLSSVPDRADRDRMAMAGGFSDRPPRVDVPLPDKPPYTAFLGSLSFDVTELDVEDFFAPEKLTSVRIVSDRDGKPKGFGYVEFASVDALKAALAKSGATLAGRQVRIGVAEPPRSGDRPGFGPSVAEEASQWRRAGPLPPMADGPSRQGPPRERSGGFGSRPADGPSGFDQMDVAGGARSGFGSRFQATPAGPANGVPTGPTSRAPRSGPPAEPLEPTKGEVASDWRTGKPVEGLNVPGPRRPGMGGEGPSGRSPSFRQRSDATEVDDKYASQERMGFGSKFTPAPTPPESPASGSRGPRNFERKVSAAPPGPSEGASNWRSARPPPSPSSATAPLATPASPSAPAERKKLALKPRSVTGGAPTEAAASSSSSRANPFGNAKPVDQSEREREIEERLRVEREQRAAEEKVRQEKLKAEREKAQKDAPTGPRAEREKGGAGKQDKGAAASPASTPTTETASAPDAAPTAAPVKAKSPPPTGAWGGGRKASGALLGEGSAAATNGSSDEAKAEESASEVDAAAKGVEEVKISS